MVKSPEYPLPLAVEPSDAGKLLARLKAKGIAAAGYDFDNRHIRVSCKDERKAIVALAEDRLLNQVDNEAFVCMLDRWAGINTRSASMESTRTVRTGVLARLIESLSEIANKSFAYILNEWIGSNTRSMSEEAIRKARADALARLIESLDGIAEARVVYFSDIWGRSNGYGKNSASVRVATIQGWSLSDETVNTTIALTAAAKANLNERNVVVVDQRGNKFRSKSGKSVGCEAVLEEQLRNRLEEVSRDFIRNYNHDIEDIDIFTEFELEIGYTKTAAEDVLRAKTPTVSVIIHLASRLKLDAAGKPIRKTNRRGEVLIDANAHEPAWERESVDFLSSDSECIRELRYLIAHISGIPYADMWDKINITMARWAAPRRPPPLVPETEWAAKYMKMEEEGALKSILNCGYGVTLELARIPSGAFMMGSPEKEEDRCEDEVLRRTMIDRALYMGIHEVTQAQYRAVMRTNPSYFRGDDLPVEYEAMEFCRRLSMKTGRIVRLPTEAEWEYACRAGTVTPFNTGETIDPEQANYHGDYAYGAGRKGVFRDRTTPAGSFPANA